MSTNRRKKLSALIGGKDTRTIRWNFSNETSPDPFTAKDLNNKCNYDQLYTFHYANRPVIDVLVGGKRKPFSVIWQREVSQFEHVPARNVDQSMEAVEVCVWLRDTVAAFVRKFTESAATLGRSLEEDYNLCSWQQFEIKFHTTVQVS